MGLAGARHARAAPLTSKERPLNLEIVARFPSGAPVVKDYLAGAPAAAPFYAGSWSDPASFETKAAEVDGRFGPDERRRAAEAVRPHDEAGRARLERFVEEGGYMVTTGQQPGLFTGPLYSIYKGLTAVCLAAELEAHLGKPVIPLFWVGSEDHDWAECNHTFVLDAENRLHKVEVADPAGDSRRPIHRIELGAELTEALDAFASMLPETDFSEEALDVLRRAYEPGRTLGRGFRETVDALLGPMGLMTTESSDRVVKEVSGPVLWDALERSVEHEAVLSETTALLGAAGYQPQVAVLAEAVNLFLEGPGGRERLYRDGAGFRLHTSEEQRSLDEIRAEVTADPHALSPNVFLRPVVESSVFPTLSYVAGPGELAYFAQLERYFALQDIRMPVVYPRIAYTLVEAKVGKVLKKHGLDVDALAEPFHEVAAAFAREEVPDDVRRALGTLRGAVGQGSAQLLEAARPIDPTLKGPVQAARNASLAAFADAEKKILQSVKRQSEIALGQLEKAQKNLFPEGRPQERCLNVFQYLVRYGDALLPALAERARELVRMKGMEVTSAEEV